MKYLGVVLSFIYILFSIDFAFAVSVYPRIEISEVYPNPLDGEQEYIELYNTYDEDVYIANWQLIDKANHNYVLPSLVIEANKYIVIAKEDSKISLNNTGDGIQLYSPDGKLSDQLIYEDSVAGLSYGLSDTQEVGWLQKPTPYLSNGSLYIDPGNKAKTESVSINSEEFVPKTPGELVDETRFISSVEEIDEPLVENINYTEQKESVLQKESPLVATPIPTTVPNEIALNSSSSIPLPIVLILAMTLIYASYSYRFEIYDTYIYVKRKRRNRLENQRPGYLNEQKQKHNQVPPWTTSHSDWNN